MDRDVVSKVLAELIIENTNLSRLVREAYEEGIKAGNSKDIQLGVSTLWNKSKSRKELLRLKQI